MMMDEVERPPRPLDTVDAPDKEKRGRHAARQMAIPGDIVIKSGSGIPENVSSHSRTLATMTETFSDLEEATLMTSSLAFMDSFELHDGMGFEIEKRKKDEEEGHEMCLSPQAKAPASDDARQRDQHQQNRRGPSDSYRRIKCNPLVQRPLAAPSLSSGDSWDEQNENHRRVSLFDAMADSRDDEEETRGHDGDDERDTPVAAADKRRMMLQFEQSQDSQSPMNDNFHSGIPKFAQGPLSHFHDDSNDSLGDMAAMAYFHRNSSTASSSYSANSVDNLSPLEDLLALEKAMKKEQKEVNEKSIMETKGLAETFKDLIYACIPGSEED